MVKGHFTQTACFLYLIVSGHILVECRRVREVVDVEDRDSLEAALDVQDESESDHPWCNPFSSQRSRSYHFEVEESENKCEDGRCMALQLVRDKTTPLIKIHQGRAWKVTQDKESNIEWNLYQPNEGMQGKDLVISLYDVEVVKLMDADSKYPDKLEITLPCKAEYGCNEGVAGSFRQKNVFELEGGLYYDEYILKAGFTKMKKITGDHFQKMLDNATQPTDRVKGGRYGKWIGGTGGALTVGGFYTAATLAGTAVQTQALVGAAVLGIVGGTVGGFVVGGFIGSAIAIGVAMMGYQNVRGYKITSAGRKMFQKLRCLPEFQTCRHNVLVPKDKECRDYM